MLEPTVSVMVEVPEPGAAIEVGLKLTVVPLGAPEAERLIAPLPPELIGRWFASVDRRQALASDIGQVPPINHELLVAVPAHYAIGVTLTLLYLFASSVFGLDPRWPMTALGFTLCTILLWLADVSSDGLLMARYPRSGWNTTIPQQSRNPLPLWF